MIRFHSQFSSLHAQFSFCTTSLNFGVECHVTCNVRKNGLELFQVLIFLLTQKLGMLFSKFETCIVIETNGMGFTNEPHDTTTYTNSKVL